MDFLQYIIPLIESMIPLWSSLLIVPFCLAFIAFVGCFIHSFIRR